MHSRPQVLDDERMGGSPEPVVVVSDTVQEFGGERFYRCGFYFQKRGRRLHRAVWEAHHGPVPDGCHIHHRDGDRSNNQIENLACLDGTDHLSLHAVERADESREIIDRIRHRAAKWHGSAEGKQWHKEHYQKHCAAALQAEFDFQCEQCGADFKGKHGSKFCSNKCKSAYRRDSGVDDERRECVVCGRMFVTNRYSKTRTCSRSCGVKSSARTRTGVHQRRE